MAFRIRQNSGNFRITDSSSVETELGSIPSAVSTTVSVKHVQFGPFVVSTFKLDNVSQSVVDGTEFQGTQIFTFPEGRISVQGVTATLQQKTTSTLASTLNASSTGAIALGTATAASTTLNGTAADLLPSTAFTSSATINVAGTAVSSALAAAAQFDGTSTAKKIFVNTAYATTTDVDGNATQTISGTVVVTWLFLGDY